LEGGGVAEAVLDGDTTLLIQLGDQTFFPTTGEGDEQAIVIPHPDTKKILEYRAAKLDLDGQMAANEERRKCADALGKIMSSGDNAAAGNLCRSHKHELYEMVVRLRQIIDSEVQGMRERIRSAKEAGDDTDSLKAERSEINQLTMMGDNELTDWFVAGVGKDDFYFANNQIEGFVYEHRVILLEKLRLLQDANERNRRALETAEQKLVKLGEGLNDELKGCEAVPVIRVKLSEVRKLAEAQT